MCKSQKRNTSWFLFVILLVTLLFAEVSIAQQKLPKNFDYEAFSLHEKAVQDTFLCNTISYYESPYYVLHLQMYPTLTAYAQRFQNVWSKNLTTVNIYIFEESSTNNSGQGIELIFYTNGFDDKPDTEVLRIPIPVDSITYYPEPTRVDVSSYDLNFENDYFYYIGFDVINPAVDTFGFMVDDGDYTYGSPSFGYYDKDDNGNFAWMAMDELYGYPYNFMIEVEYCYDVETIRVPEDYSTIQEAVDAASGFDTILVNDGFYTGAGNQDIQIYEKSLFIRSVNGAEHTILDGSGSSETGLMFFAAFGNSSRYFNEIDGFTFANFNGAYGGVILGNYYQNFTIKNSVFYNNYARYRGGAIDCGGVDLLIENCTFSNNSTVPGGSVIYISGGNPTIRNTIIAHSINSKAISTFPTTISPYFDIQNTNIYGNQNGNWTEEINSFTHINGNISEDPLFCNTSIGDLHINEESFCNPTHPLNANGVQIGFYGVNCFGCDDTDSDGICDLNDNCLTNYNPLQIDTDYDGIGDDCDPCINDPENDADDDGYCSDVDNCPEIYNPSQSDIDADLLGDDCDNCITAYNPEQSDFDLDGIGDSCDTCTDTDNDGFGNLGFPMNTCPEDNCFGRFNPDQLDSDNDGVGDSCDWCHDTDGDGYGNPGFDNLLCDVDNCPDISNPDQGDSNNDGIGDACCCIGIRGNLNGDPDEIIDISDLVALVDYMFGEAPTSPMHCFAEYDVSGDSIIDISDLVAFVAFMFQDGPPPINYP